MSRAFCAAVILILSIFIGIACSGGGLNPSAPQDAVIFNTESKRPSDRLLWGIWNVHFDAAETAIVIEPVRSLSAHFNITDWLLPPACDDCFEVSVNSFDPVTRILDVDVTLRNPTHLNGHDVRGILYTNDYGHELRNADAWTGLWDVPGGDDINPFCAFAKEELHRIFAADAEHTENYLVYIPIPPNYNQITFAVDASWPGNCNEPYAFEGFTQLDALYQYPGASAGLGVYVHDWQDDVDSVGLIAPEITGEDITPFEHVAGTFWTLQVVNNTGAGAGDYLVKLAASSTNSGELLLYDYVTITVTQTEPPVVTAIHPDKSGPGIDLVDVKISGDGFFGPDVVVKLKKVGEPDIEAVNVVVDNVDEITCDINIPLGAALGLYDVEVEISGGLSAVGAGLFEIIDPGPFDPIIVTPEELNFCLEEVVIEGDYAYASTKYRGLYIFDISDPANPDLVNSIPVEGYNWDLDVSSGYAYLISGSGPLSIVDVDPPETAAVVKEIDLLGSDLVIQDDHLFVVSIYGLSVIDVSIPEDATVIVEKAYQWDYPYCVDVAGDYMYVGYLYWTWPDTPLTALKVVDISNLDSIATKGLVHLGGLVSITDIRYSDNHAYLGNANNLYAINVSDPVHPMIVYKEPKHTSGLTVSGGYVFVTSAEYELEVYKIDPVEHLIYSGNLELLGTPAKMDAQDEHLCVANPDFGLQVVNITEPESPYCEGGVPSMGRILDVAIDGGYAYTITGDTIKIVDISVPDSASIVKVVEFPESMSDYPHGGEIAVEDGYAYVVGSDFYVFDIEPVETTNLVQLIDFMWYPPSCIAVSGAYAFIDNGFNSTDLDIVDIDPPESAEIIHTATLEEWPYHIQITNDYAFTTSSHKLSVIDINPPETAQLLSSIDIDLPYGSDLAVTDGYVYFGYNYELGVADVTTPDFPVYVGSIPFADAVMGMDIWGQYLFMSNRTNGLFILDISQPQDPSIVYHTEIPGWTLGIDVYGDYAYVCQGYPHGLQIIKLK